MAQWIRGRNAVDMYLQDLSSRVIAESGIATDRYHLGKLILQGLKDAPNFLLQIDGATGETEIFESALKRSVKCATALKKLGIKKGDVIILMAPNHIHLCIPMYAALYLGAISTGIDITLKMKELKETFNINKPSMIFCQNERASDVNLAIEALNLKSKIVTFDESDKYLTFNDLLNTHGEGTSIEDFKATDFDPTETIALLLPTSGTTGLPKSAAVTHANFTISCPTMWVLFDKCPSPTRLSCILSPIQWYSAVFQYVFSPILRNSRLQSSLPMTVEHAYYIINKYKELIPNTCLPSAYGLSEISGLVFIYDSTNPQSVGRPAPIHEIRLVSPDTKKDVTEPNIPGELWIKSAAVFKGYYNNPEITTCTITADGWFKTGDLFKRDERWYFYFVDRIKMLLKYRNHQISPVEIENVIAQHPAVFEVAVTGVPHPEHGDLPVACIVPHKNATVTAQEIKDLVEKSLADSKQLRGGVIFMKNLPMTSTSKINRLQLATLALTSERL